MRTGFDILLVEDNLDDVLLLRRAFQSSGVASRLHSVTDGIQAQSYLRGLGEYSNRQRHPLPDFLLIDLNMPRMNGFELLEWLRQEPSWRRLVVHVLTASGRKLDVERAHDLGANSYLVKPIRLDQLIALVLALHRWHEFTLIPSLGEGQRENGMAGLVQA